MRRSSMKTRIVRIGNSQGIRIPKPLLAQTGISGEGEISAEDNTLVIRPARKPREGWEEAFQKQLDQHGEDPLAEEVDYIPTRWDEEEWEW
jgi:antitoxin MazE